jgi:hypothetical protein
MHTVSVSRRTLLSALAALALLAGVLLADTPKASAAMSDCPANSVCAWVANDYTGAWSAWAASDTGCHGHADKPDLRSFYNNTSNKTVQLGGAGNLLPGWAVTNPSGGPVTGDLCW